MEINKRENEKREALLFAKFLKIKQIKENLKHGEYDYIIGQNAVEISEIVDQKESQLWAGWYRTKSFLEDELYTPLNRFNNTETFYISIPMDLRIRSKITANEYAQELANQMEKGVKEFTYRKHLFKIHSFNSTDERVNKIHILGISGGLVNPEGVLLERFNSKLETANKQLASAQEECKKIMLFSNRYYHTDEKTLLKVFTHLEPQISKYSNIDEIWIQFIKEKKVDHLLYYCKDPQKNEAEAYCSILNLAKISSQIENTYLRKKIYKHLINIIAKRRTLEIYPKEEDRIEIVRFFEKCLITIPYKNIYPIIKNFLQDPSPTILKEVPQDCEYHNMIANEKEYNVIWTVQGELSSIFINIIRLATETKDSRMIKKCLKDTLRILNETKNLYVWSLWLSPLSELISSTHKLGYPSYLTKPLIEIFLKEDGLLNIAIKNKVLKNVLLQTVINKLNFLPEEKLHQILYQYQNETNGFIPFLSLYLYGGNWFKKEMTLPSNVRNLNTDTFRTFFVGLITRETKVPDEVYEEFYLELWRCLNKTPKNKKLISLVEMLLDIKPPNSEQAINYIKQNWKNKD